MKPKKLIVYSDGASRGNPGPAGVGVVIEDELGRCLKTVSKFIGHATNNEAEYSGVIFALETAFPFAADQVELRLDSELVVRQLTGKYKVRSPALKPFYEKARHWLGRFKFVSIKHVPREQNKGADRLAGQAIDRRV
ncbi:MAG: ribonuclease HI family protein [Chloroflexi bacterium]|nr:ribonuclease HI family protein [Chloroflexota bacterium]